jgi:cytidine deaminase
MCARHLISAGIKRVVYIEPYPKSMTKDLYRRAVRVDEDLADADAVIFDAFVGVAPRRYADLFEMPKRKDSKGAALSWDRGRANPRLDRYITTYIEPEKTIRVYLFENKSEFGLGENFGSRSEGGAIA